MARFGESSAAWGGIARTGPAAAITGLTWLADQLAAVDYLVITPLGVRPITLGLVAAGTTASGSASWAVLALVERYTSRHTAAVLTSSIVPIFVLPADAPSRITLTVLHCLAAAILIPGLRHTR